MIQLKFLLFRITKGRLRLDFYAEKIDHFSSTYEKVNITDSFKHPVATGRLNKKIMKKKMNNKQ